MYHKNVQTQGTIGALYIFPTNYTPDDCFSCEGYSLAISDYLDLYRVVGTTFNQAGDGAGTFRIPNYNITGRFLQPSTNVGIQIGSGLPNITGTIHYGATNSGSGGGAFYTVSNAGCGDGDGDGGVYNPVIGFDASRSNAIYGSSSTVQPPSQTVHVCIKYK